MQTVLIVIHLMIVLALVGIVLVQRSEGGGLGIGGGSGFMSARGAANALTRTTGILAAAFFVTSLALGILARYGDSPSDIIDQISVPDPRHRLGRSRPARWRANPGSSSGRDSRRYPGSTSRTVGCAVWPVRLPISATRFHSPARARYDLTRVGCIL